MTPFFFQDLHLSAANLLLREWSSMTETATMNKPIKASEINPKFKYELLKVHGSEKILQCFQCGTCTSDCPIAKFSDTYRPRQIIRMAQLGLKERVLKSETLWLCASCFTCTDRCPQNIEVASIIRVLRNLAAEQGIVPLVFKEQTLSILKSGYAYKIPELRKNKRISLGLPPIPKSDPEKICKILKKVGIQKIIENRETQNGE